MKINEAQALAVAANKAQMLSLLKAGEYCTVEYEGQGDSGNIDNVYFHPEAKKIGKRPCVLATAEFVGDAQYALKQTDATLETLAKEMCWVAIERPGHSGFENNAGGSGELTIDGTKQTVVLEHSDRIVETCDYTHEL